MSKDARDFGSSYTYSEQVLHFQSGVKVSSSEDENQVIHEACSPLERVTIFVSFNPPFYQGYAGSFPPFLLLYGDLKGPQHCSLPVVP